MKLLTYHYPYLLYLKKKTFVKLMTIFFFWLSRTTKNTYFTNEVIKFDNSRHWINGTFVGPVLKYTIIKEYTNENWVMNFENSSSQMLYNINKYILR